MKRLSYWEQFLSTGTIEDYLSYRNVCRKENGAGIPEEEEEVVKSEGTGQCYRDHIKSGTGGGV